MRAPSHPPRRGRALRAVLGCAVALSACSGSTPRDVSAGTKRSEFPPEASGRPLPRAEAPREAAPPPRPEPPASPRALARAQSRAIAIDDTHVYFGDADDDALLAVPKAGGEPVSLARRAPVRRALSREADLVAWIATPGNAVLRMPIQGGLPTTLRDRGIFADLTIEGGDVFVTQVTGAGGVLMRISGSTAARLGAFDGQPRGIAADDAHVFVATSRSLLRAPRKAGQLTTLAEGARFDAPVVSGEHVYALMTAAGGEASIVRVPKTGGDRETLARGTRPDAPFALAGEELYVIDASRPALRAVHVAGGASRVVGEGSAIASTVAIAVDDDAVFFATGDVGLIMALPLR